MSDLKDKFQKYDSKYLLQLRARGSELSDEAHKIIEEIFNKRQEYLPAKPSKPILINDRHFKKSQNFALLIAILIVAFPAYAFVNDSIKEFIRNHFPLTLFIYICLIVYWIARFFRRLALPVSQRRQEDWEKQIRKDRLTELMVCAGEGDIGRMKELMDYGEDVNARSKSDATALMYAARRNHVAAVELLLKNGADQSLKTKNKRTALDIAKKFGNSEIVEALNRHV